MKREAIAALGVESSDELPVSTTRDVRLYEFAIGLRDGGLGGQLFAGSVLVSG